MSDVDFNELLSQTASSAEKPKPLPVGTYSAMVESYELVRSSRKDTPGVEVTFKVLGALEDTDLGDFPQEKVAGKSLRETFWLTNDARYRLTEFMKKVGLDVDNRPYSELLIELPNAAVNLSVIQTPSTNRSGEMVVYNNISGFHEAV